jgi:hypothetical protein
MASDAPPSTPFPELPRFGEEGIFIHYIRLARVVSGTSYYVMPVAKGCSSSVEEVLLNDRSSQSSGFGGATLTQIQQGHDLGSQGRGSSSVVSGLVPDGVAKVTLTYPPSGPNNISPTRQPAVTVTTAPVNNVFVVRVHRDPGSASLPKMIVWRSAKGKVIKKIHGSQ